MYVRAYARKQRVFYSIPRRSARKFLSRQSANSKNLIKFDMCVSNRGKDVKVMSGKDKNLIRFFLDIGVCEETFVFIHDIDNKSFKIVKNGTINGVTCKPRIHRHKCRAF